MLFLFTACCKKASTDLKGDITLDTLLQETYGTEGEINTNTSGSFAILFKETKKYQAQEFPDIEFTIVNTNTLQISASGKESFASISWEDDLNVKIVLYPDQIPNPDEPPLRAKYYTINAETGKKSNQL